MALQPTIALDELGDLPAFQFSHEQPMECVEPWAHRRAPYSNAAEAKAMDLDFNTGHSSVNLTPRVVDLNLQQHAFGVDDTDVPKQMAHIPIGWKHMNRATSGPEARTTPSEISALEACLLNAEGGKRGSEMFTPVQGMSFDSCQEAYELYNLFAWENGFGIRHGKSKRSGSGYRLMHKLVCQCQGKNKNENSESCRTNCPSRVRLLRSEDHGWYVSIFVNNHNHPLSRSREETKQWNSHNEIDPILKDFIQNLRENNVSLSKLYNILNSAHGESTGTPFRKQNLRYLCSHLAQDAITDDMIKTAQLLEEMKAVDQNLSVCIETDSEGSVKFILWCTGKNRQDYAVFGDVVTFDTTYRTNLYNMPFGIFVGVNNHYQSIIFGGVLMREDTTVGFEWAFGKFVQTMDGKHPVTMLTDQCRAMEAAIKSTLPHTRHRWCKWHVLKCAKENLGSVYSKNNGFKSEFHSLINDIICVREFETKWAELLQKYKLTQNKYLDKLYSRRNMWAKPYFSSIFCAGMTSTQRSESANHLLKQYIPRSSTMYLFVKQYNNMLKSRSTDEGREQHITTMKRRKYNGGHPIEVDAAEIYTSAVYKKFEDELYQSSSFVVSRCISETEYEILLRNDILKIPSKNIVKRWTKKAKDGLLDSEQLPIVNTHADEVASRQNILYIAAVEAVKEAAHCKSMFERSVKVFREMKMEALSIRGQCVQDVETSVDGVAGLSKMPVNAQGSIMLPPKRVKPKGRPATIRQKSRLEYVKLFKQKNKPVANLYGDENAKPSGPSGAKTQDMSRKGNLASGKIIRCSRCKIPGHNRASCTLRGM